MDRSYTYLVLPVSRFLQTLHEQHAALEDMGLLLVLVIAAKNGALHVLHTLARLVRRMRGRVSTASKKALGSKTQGPWVFNT
jgi:hypothetical protein